MSYLKPGLHSYKEDHEKLVQQVEELRRQDALEKARKIGQLTPVSQITTNPVDGSPVDGAGVLKRLRLPACVAGMGFVAIRVHAALQSARLHAREQSLKEKATEAAAHAERELEDAITNLQHIVGDRVKFDASDDQTKETFVAELKLRASELEEILPLYRELGQEVPPNLGTRSAKDLSLLKENLAERCAASRSLLFLPCG